MSGMLKNDRKITPLSKYSLTFSIIEFIIQVKNSIIEKEGITLPRERFKTLTEQMFYILLCLREELRGMDILEMVRAFTNGRVNIGSGTLYDLLEQFLKEGAIEETKAEGRRRSYIITEKGQQMLDKEYGRLLGQVADYDRIIKKGASS